MSTPPRPGLRAARGLLTLLEENDPEEFQAAEEILGADKRLVEILHQLRQYSEEQEQPLSIDDFYENVRTFLTRLNLSKQKLKEATGVSLGLEVHQKALHKEAFIEQLMQQIIEKFRDHRDVEVECIVDFLEVCFDLGGRSIEELIAFLRSLITRALVANLAVFPTPHSLAVLAEEWGAIPVHYLKPHSRREVIEHLLNDIEAHSVDQEAKIARLGYLLKQGLRGPADAEIAAIRKGKPRKAHGG